MGDNRLTVEHYVAECFVKCANVILGSRVRNGLGSQSVRDRRASRWFLLEVDEVEAAAKDMELWRKDPSQPMLIEIYLPAGAASTHAAGEAMVETLATELVVERWQLNYTRGSSAAAQLGAARGLCDEAAMYKRLIILVRSLYSYVRVLPAYRLFRACKRQAGAPQLQFRLTAVVAAAGGKAGMARAHTFTFAPVATPSGAFCVSVTHVHQSRRGAPAPSPPPAFVSPHARCLPACCQPVAGRARKPSCCTCTGGVVTARAREACATGRLALPCFQALCCSRFSQRSRHTAREALSMEKDLACRALCLPPLLAHASLPEVFALET